MSSFYFKKSIGSVRNNITRYLMLVGQLATDDTCEGESAVCPSLNIKDLHREAHSLVEKTHTLKNYFKSFLNNMYAV